MGKLAFLFAGQGAQKPGMGQELYRADAAARAVFDAVEAVRPGTRDDCFAGSEERLRQTDVTQPCVFAAGMAAAQALAAAGVRPDAAAGFSLGEMAALTFAGAFDLAQGFALTVRRAAAMQKACEAQSGAMAAVLRMQDDAVEALCGRFSGVWPANYNADGQLVVSGEAGAVAAFCAAVKEEGGAARPLAVGGAFHCPLMDGAADAFAGVLAGADFAAPRLPVYANATARPYAEPFRELLAGQLVRPVRWKETMRRLAADGYDTFVEVGCGKTLTGLARRILPEATVLNVEDAASLAQTLRALRDGGA